jgi:hypothetical protein
MKNLREKHDFVALAMAEKKQQAQEKSTTVLFGWIG